MSTDPDLEEYFTLVKSVSEFDQRLYGLFLVAAASSLAFWSLEGTMKGDSYHSAR